MADFTISSLNTAVVGVASTSLFLIQSTSQYSVEVSNGTVNIGNVDKSNFNVFTGATPAIPAKRPQTGQVFPRGVYNK